MKKSIRKNKYKTNSKKTIKESSDLIAGNLSQKSEVLQETSNKLSKNIDELSEFFTKEEIVKPSP